MTPYQTRYRTTNWPEYNRSRQNWASLTVWMSSDIPWLGNGRSGANGRPQVYADAAIQAVLIMKVLFKLAIRQARGLVNSLLKLLSLDWPVPCFSTVSRRQVTLSASQLFAPLALRLNNVALAVTDLEAMISWYQNAFGLQVEERGHFDPVNADFAMLTGDGFRRELVSRAGGEHRPADRSAPPLVKSKRHVEAALTLKA
ncbi:transposase [Crenobacter sp. SG2303]|uniref:Transposase n=1 Tax=Crenobacter oryzisoli TaxID=3056844 RepID=A0ABT7XSJ1_9NEIS|nr:transposase [Crenobacter sp. SG2303]MDN0076700.1 transposase [Crenobacter sp. SG2303]